ALAMTAIVSAAALTGCGGSGTAATTAAAASAAPAAASEAAAPAQAAPAASADARVLKLACTKSSESYMVKELENFSKKVNELSGGSLVVELYPSSQLGGQDEIMEGIGMGTIEMSFLPASVCEGFFPKVAVPGTLFVAQNEEHALKIWQSDYAQSILDEMAAAINVKCFDFVIEGSRNIWTVNPVNQLSDLKGVKLRVPGAPSFVNAFEALGANPTPMALSEVYTGLQTKIVEGLEMDTPTIVVNNMQELCKYCYKSGHGVSIMSFMISNNLWNELSADQQNALKTAADESTEIMNKMYYTELEANEKSLEEQGVTFTTPSADDYAQMVEILNPVIEKQLEGLATMDELNALRDLAK
nr:TRAP transporter substrate-binding protein [Lachnospiraceae bacterium]